MKSESNEARDETYQKSKGFALLISLGVAIVCLFIAVSVILLFYAYLSGVYGYYSFLGGGIAIPDQTVTALLVAMFGILLLGVYAGYGIGKYRYLVDAKQ
jgi:hypothetical protein